MNTTRPSKEKLRSYWKRWKVVSKHRGIWFLLKFLPLVFDKLRKVNINLLEMLLRTSAHGTKISDDFAGASNLDILGQLNNRWVCTHNPPHRTQYLSGRSCKLLKTTHQSTTLCRYAWGEGDPCLLPRKAPLHLARNSGDYLLLITSLTRATIMDCPSR